MPDDRQSPSRDTTLFDVLERIRADRFPHLDRDLVRELLRLHAEPGDERERERQIDQLVSERAGAV